MSSQSLCKLDGHTFSSFEMVRDGNAAPFRNVLDRIGIEEFGNSCFVGRKAEDVEGRKKRQTLSECKNIDCIIMLKLNTVPSGGKITAMPQ
jgi:hypothetical protein